MSNIVNGRASVTAELATRIAEALETSPEYWLNLQNAVDLYDARQVVAASDRPVRRDLLTAAS
jgi:addiction module HigA family antidote